MVKVTGHIFSLRLTMRTRLRAAVQQFIIFVVAVVPRSILGGIPLHKPHQIVINLRAHGRVVVALDLQHAAVEQLDFALVLGVIKFGLPVRLKQEPASLDLYCVPRRARLR